MTYCICSCGVVCEGPEGPVVALLAHRREFHRRESRLTLTATGWLRVLRSAS